MRRRRSLFTLAVTMLGGTLLSPPSHAQPPSPWAGVWTLNRSLSEFPAEIGFNPAWMTAPLADAQSGERGRGGRGRQGGAAAPFSARPESYEDARRVQLLTTEVRNPPARLTIVDSVAAVTITNELGQSRTVHPDGRQESIDIQGISVGMTAKRDGDHLVVVYRAGPDREIRYTYSHAPGPPRLEVDVQFLERGSGDKAHRVYDPGAALPPATATSAPVAPAAESVDQRPGAELRGLKNLGILVEDLSPQAIACGLNRDAIESALSKPLTDGGFTVRRNSDEDTYVYVNVMTSTLQGGTCVSRYDAFLYTHGTATLSYRDRPVLVQVSLMHRGGIGTSAPAAHAAAVVRGLAAYVDLFVTQIRDANK